MSTVTAIEDLHYGALTVSDKSLGRNVYSWLALAANNTNTVNVGTCVTNPYTRNPGMTAAAIGGINEIADGRTMLGMGIGGGDAVAPFGIEVNEPIDTVRDAVDTIRRLLDGESVTMARDEFELNDASLTFEPPESTIPIYIGGRGPRLLALGGAVADGVFAGGGICTPEGMEYARNRIEVGARTTDRDPEAVDLRFFTSISIAEDYDIAVDAITDRIVWILQEANPTALNAAGVSESELRRVRELDPSGMTPSELRSEIPTGLIEQFAIVGTVEDCYDRVAELAAEGITDFTVVARENDANNRPETLELFSDRVIEPLTS